MSLKETHVFLLLAAHTHLVAMLEIIQHVLVTLGTLEDLQTVDLNVL